MMLFRSVLFIFLAVFSTGFALDESLEAFVSGSARALHRVRRNLKEGVHGHHGDHGSHNHHGDHGDSGHHDHHDHNDSHPVDTEQTVSKDLEVWSTISATDKFGCVAKLSCHLQHENATNQITPKGQQLLNYITQLPPSDSQFYEVSVVKAPYLYACFIGGHYGGTYCSQFFPECNHSEEVMAQFVNNFSFENSA